MSVIGIICWIIFGGFIGWLAKLIYPGDEGITGWGTVALGVVGSFVGGAINWLIGWGDHVISGSGFLMSTVGAVVCCYLYTKRQPIMDWVEKKLDDLGVRK